MKFCDECGSYMEKTIRGFTCPKCGNEAPYETNEFDKRNNSYVDPIYVVRATQDGRARVNQTCPRCGNNEAFRLFSTSSGEHAGIRQERTVEHFKCTKCSYSWSRS